MKISIASDLHLEFHELELVNKDNSEILVLAGDIMVVEKIKRYPFNDTRLANGSKVQIESWSYQRFFREVSQRWKHVIYIAGNHEHYEGTFDKTDQIIRENLAYISDNIHYLNLDAFHYNDYVFTGGTLWTNLNKRDPMTSFHLKEKMNDYSRIRTTGNSSRYQTVYRKLKPEDTVHQHDRLVQYLKFVASENRDKKLVVVSHHGPTFNSVPPHYRGDFLMNGGYVSDLSDLILDNENIKLWVHGHTHDDFDYMVGDHTRVVCNPRGYAKYEPRVNTFEIKTVEI